MKVRLDKNQENIVRAILLKDKTKRFGKTPDQIVYTLIDLGVMLVTAQQLPDKKEKMEQFLSDPDVLDISIVLLAALRVGIQETGKDTKWLS